MKDMEWEVLRRGRKRSVSNFWEFTKKFFLTSEIFGLSHTTNFNYGSWRFSVLAVVWVTSSISMQD